MQRARPYSSVTGGKYRNSVARNHESATKNWNLSKLEPFETGTFRNWNYSSLIVRSRLRRSHVAKQHAALGLVLLGGLDDGDGYGARIDLVVLDDGVGEILDQRPLLLDRTAGERIENDFRHQTLL